jgi:hypothetical protein
MDPEEHFQMFLYLDAPVSYNLFYNCQNERIFMESPLVLLPKNLFVTPSLWLTQLSIQLGTRGFFSGNKSAGA